MIESPKDEILLKCHSNDVWGIYSFEGTFAKKAPYVQCTIVRDEEPELFTW
jgi:hypothetical protein